MGLKEILAAKKAAAEATPTKEQAVEQKVAAEEITHQQADAEIKVYSTHPLMNVNEQKTVETPKVEEPAITAAPKVLSFAERMAQKKALATAATTVSVPTAPVIGNSTSQAESTNEDTAEGKVEVAMDPALVAESLSEEPAFIPASVATTIPPSTQTGKVEVKAKNEEEAEASPEVAQAYADIKDRIEKLESLEDSVLSGQMSELKKALMKNPSAVSLMLDTDIGKMVVALRRITKEAIVEAATEKPKGRKPKTSAMPVDADAIAKVFDEL